MKTIILAGLFLMIFVGGEVGYASFVLVYANLQLDFTEAQG